MKISLFSQVAYRDLPSDFEERYESVCSTPYSLTGRGEMYGNVPRAVERAHGGGS